MSREAHPSGRTVYPDELKQRPWWVNWVLAVRYDEIDDGGDVDEGAIPTKQPVAPYMNGDAEPCRWNSSLPPEEHPATSFDTVADWEGWSVSDLPAPDRVLSDELGLGIITPVGGGEGEPIILLDWDDVRDPETGEIHPVCASALEEAGGFAEISQSGEGVHQFVFGELPGGRKKFLRHIDSEPFVGDDRPMVEMYASGRLTAMTGIHVEGCGEDVVEGQNLIDKLCWRFGPASNNSPGRVSDPFADEREDSDSEEDSQDWEVPSHDEVADAMEQYVEFNGEHPDDWDIERPRTVKYAAVLHGRDRKQNAELPHTANWKLIRYAALLGEEAGLSQQQIIEDLQSHPAWENGDDTERCRRHVKSTFRAVENDRLSPPSVETLKKRGLLPDDYVIFDEIHTDNVLSGEQKWKAWSSARLDGVRNTDVPTGALRYIAQDRGYYNFDACPEEAEELPPKAHNKALYWVNNYWPEEADLHLADEEEVTETEYKKRDKVVYGWEDVRYIYEEDKNAARHAAEAVLQSEYEFMTIDEYDQLHIYDEATGTYAPELAEVRGEVKDGLGKHWSTHEVNEILARLRQSPRPSVDDLNGANFDNPHICVKNGVLDIFAEEVKEHSPEYYFTDRLPVAYDAEADTSAYDEFLDGLTERPEDKQALLEMVGHAITPDAYSRGWQKFLILTGDTNNGKSVFFSRVQSLLNGPEGKEGNTANVKLAKIARNQFSNNSVYGKWANIAGEIDGKKIRATASIKDITGGDPVEIEPKGEDSFFDALDATFMFAANDPPIIGERDKDAIASRIVPIELPNTFVDNPDGEYEKQKKSEVELRDWLDTEKALTGFLRLAVEGANRFEENGDVSLPESNEERLRMYERNADPMREFGERCLKNSGGDYLVKADVTTIYKEFASSLGHEVGQNTNKTLHNVLRGLPDLNYTDSRPRSPDYTDTSLDLRGWDERKFVINRVTLTEEGLKHAETAGLIEEPAEESEDVEYLEAGAVDLSADVSDRETLPPVRGTVAAVWENRFGQAVTELMDEDGSVDIQIVGFGSADQVPLTPGVEYELSGLRARNPAGEEPYVEFRPTTTTNRLEEPGEIDSHGQDPDDDLDDDTDEEIPGPSGEASAVEGMAAEARETAADGGEDTADTEDTDASTTDDTTEYEGVTGKVREHLRLNVEKGEKFTAPSVAGELSGSESPGDVTDALIKLKTEGLLERKEGGLFELL